MRSAGARKCFSKSLFNTSMKSVPAFSFANKKGLTLFYHSIPPRQALNCGRVAVPGVRESETYASPLTLGEEAPLYFRNALTQGGAEPSLAADHGRTKRSVD